MIGFFPPLIQRVLDAGAQLTVVELRADLVGEREGYWVTQDPAALRRCNKVLSTSTVLLNHTLDAMLAHCAGARRLAMVGPGAGCLPDALFAARRHAAGRKLDRRPRCVQVGAWRPAPRGGRFATKSRAAP